MTTEEYNFYKFLLDLTQFALDNWKWVLGLLFGGGVCGIYIENRWKIVKKFKSHINQKGDINQAVPIQDSPNATPQIAARDINNFFGTTEPRVANVDDALRPQVNVLSTEQNFICIEIQMLFQNRGEIFNPRDDYSRAITFLISNQHQNAATLFMRIYGRINIHFQSVQFFRDAQQDLVNFGFALQQIENLHNSSDAADDINVVLLNIEQATRNLLAILRI